jgi:hypothetical protein
MIRTSSLAIAEGTWDCSVGNNGVVVNKRGAPPSRAQATIPRRSRSVRPLPPAVARGCSRSERKVS